MKVKQKIVFHVIGVTQYFGTCKYHLFKDYPLMNKRRRDAHFVWGTRPGTKPEIQTVAYSPYKLEVCRHCLRRSGESVEYIWIYTVNSSNQRTLERSLPRNKEGERRAKERISELKKRGVTAIKRYTIDKKAFY